MMVEPGVLGPLAVSLLAVARYGDQVDLFQPWLLPEVPGDLIAVHPGQADVQEDHVRRLSLHRLQCPWAGMDRPDLMPGEPKEYRQAFGGVHVVIHHEHAQQAALWPRWFLGGFGWN